MNGTRIVNPHKMSRFTKKALDLMETEELNVAEAEAAPEWIANAVKKNSEWHKKAKPFTVYRENINPQEVP